MSIKDQVSPLIICLMTIKYKELIGFSEENSKSPFTLHSFLTLRSDIREEMFIEVQIPSVANLSGVK
jgi:hypothetical protein